MSEEPRRRRAPAMNLEDRREAIVEATLPLLTQHGANITTSQIATAANIAEGTVFRAFKDKQELLACCIGRALLADDEVERIQAISRDLPVADRLAEATGAVSGYLDRMWGLMSTLRDSGFEPHKHGEHKGPQEEMQRIAVAVADLFEDRTVRVERLHAARLLLGLVFTNRMQGKGFGEAMAEPTQLVELFLHGVLVRGGKDE